MRILKVRGVPGVKVGNPHTQSMRWVGKEASANGLFIDCEQQIQDHPDIRDALRDGDLEACDAETAKIAGIPFKASKPSKSEETGKKASS